MGVYSALSMVDNSGVHKTLLFLVVYCKTPYIESFKKKSSVPSTISLHLNPVSFCVCTSVLRLPLFDMSGRSQSRAAAEPAFSVSEFIQDTVIIPFEDLLMDTNMQYGQIRRLDPAHRQELVDEFIANPPSGPLELTTWASQGVNCAPMST